VDFAFYAVDFVTIPVSGFRLLVLAAANMDFVEGWWISWISLFRQWISW